MIINCCKTSFCYTRITFNTLALWMPFLQPGCHGNCRQDILFQGKFPRCLRAADTSNSFPSVFVEKFAFKWGMKKKGAHIRLLQYNAICMGELVCSCKTPNVLISAGFRKRCFHIIDLRTGKIGIYCQKYFAPTSISPIQLMRFSLSPKSCQTMTWIHKPRLHSLYWLSTRTLSTGQFWDFTALIGVPFFKTNFQILWIPFSL